MRDTQLHAAERGTYLETFLFDRIFVCIVEEIVQRDHSTVELITLRCSWMNEYGAMRR